MKFIIAKTGGFCMGVRRAVELALDAPAKYQKPIYTFGPLIHNPQVLALFAEKGVRILKHIPEKGHGTVLIRAHGVPPSAKRQLVDAGFKVIDATCPRVVKVQSIIKSRARKGYAVIIIGDPDHPEVVGLLGHAGERGQVVESLEALKSLPDFERAIIVAQTTQNLREYRQIKQWTERHHPHYMVFDTICDSTERRQAEVRRIADRADAVIVVGGKNSGNTQRLAEIVEHVDKPVYPIETEDELDPAALSQYNTIAVTAGASTPGWIIKRVLRTVDQIPLRRGRGWRTLWLHLQRFLLLSNLYVALGAGSLSYAAMKVQGLPAAWPAPLVAILYVLSMHILNNLTGRAENRYNDPDREAFYRQYKFPLTIMAVVAGATGLNVAFRMGPIPFWTLLSMSLLGLSYNVRVIPKRWAPNLKFRCIRDLPGSKTILIALAWGVVTAWLPALAETPGQWGIGLAVFLWATGIVFCRTAYFDILDMQGDRIVGKETIPLLLGPARSFKMLKLLLSAMILLPIVLAGLGVLAPLAYLLAICPVLLWGIVAAQEHGNLLPGIRMEFRVESVFILFGCLAFLYETIVVLLQR
jgi:4-hydroxy-3-methylbut-2-enyl diphosphate reductase